MIRKFVKAFEIKRNEMISKHSSFVIDNYKNKGTENFQKNDLITNETFLFLF